jgi:hypothetical protein
MLLVNGFALMSDEFFKFYEKFSGCSATELKRTPEQKVPGVTIVHDCRLKDDHIFELAGQLLEALDYCTIS